MLDHSFYFAAGLNLLINLLYAVLALLAAAGAVRLLDRYMFPEIDFVDEIKKGNLAASVFAASLLLFVAVVIGLALRS